MADLATSEIVLVSRTPAGQAGNGPSRASSLSADGIRVAFASSASDLSRDDRDPHADVFLFDRRDRRVDLVSHGVPGLPAAADSDAPSLSADGRVVAYQSIGLQDGAHAGSHGVVRAELDTGVRTCVSCASAGALAAAAHATFPSLSADGSSLTYLRRGSSAPVTERELWLYDHADGRARPIWARTDGARSDASLPMGELLTPRLSADGRWLTFVIRPAATTRGGFPGRAQIYVKALPDGPVVLVSAASNGKPGNGMSLLPSITADGSRIAFQSTASNLPCNAAARRCEDINLVADIFVWERATGAITRVTPPSRHPPWLDPSEAPVLSADGRVLAFLSRHPVSDDDGRADYDLYVTRPET